MGRPSAAAARDTRRAILDAALDLFAERGFHAASVRALAAGAGVRESAIYHYFPSKEAILDEMFAERDRMRTAHIEEALAVIGDRTLAEVLNLMIERFLAFASDPGNRKFFRVIVGLAASDEVPQALLERHMGVPRSALKLVEELQRSGRIRRDVSPEVFLMHVSAPLFFGCGLFGGRRLVTAPLKQFIKQHVA